MDNNIKMLMSILDYQQAKKGLETLGVKSEDLPSSFTSIPLLSMFMNDSMMPSFLLRRKFDELIPEESKKESIDKKKKELDVAHQRIRQLEIAVVRILAKAKAESVVTTAILDSLVDQLPTDTPSITIPATPPSYDKSEYIEIEMSNSNL